MRIFALACALTWALTFVESGMATSGTRRALFTVGGSRVSGQTPITIVTQKPGSGGSGGGGGPTITSFSAISGPNNIWTFSGSVSDSNESGIIVQLTLPNGTSTVLACDGSGDFSIVMTLQANIQGFASAVATNANDLSSASKLAQMAKKQGFQQAPP